MEYIKYAMVINRKKIRNKNEERILKMKIRKTNEWRKKESWKIEKKIMRVDIKCVKWKETAKYKKWNYFKNESLKRRVYSVVFTLSCKL